MNVAEEFRAGRVPAHVLLRAEKGRVEELLRRYANAYKIVWERFREEMGIDDIKLPYHTFYRWVRRNLTDAPLRARPNPASASRPVGAPRGGVTDREEKEGKAWVNVEEMLIGNEEKADTVLRDSKKRLLKHFQPKKGGDAS